MSGKGAYVKEFNGGVELSTSKNTSSGIGGFGDFKDGDENEARGNWTGRMDFLMSCIGFAVGLGNVWRFPYLAFSNGGASFLIPYVVILIIAGVPMFYFELAFGQFANLGPVTIWRASPIFKGIGWGMVIISGLVCIYYNVIIAWAFYYLFASFTSKLPWTDCTNSWNDLSCRDMSVNSTNATYNVPGNFKGFNMKPWPCPASTSDTSNCTIYQTPSEQYFERIVLGYVNNTGYWRRMDEPIGAPQWHTTLCLLLAWIIVYLCLIKGVKSSGKVVYVTATFPYVILTILLIRGATLPGAKDGILFYLTPSFEKLADTKVWASAAVQIFYTLGIAFGGLMTMASYNRFQNNCYRDAIIVPIINCSTSFFAGFTIFSVIGYMSYKTGVPVKDVAKSGPGLAFVAYPEGIAAMPVAPLWSILFFLMLILLGMDSQFAMMETVLTACLDEWPYLKKTFKREAIFKLVVCCFLFFLGIPQCCPGGIYWFTMVDWFSAGYSLFAIGFLELIAVCYVYGIKKFIKDIEMMIGFKPGPYWIGCWMFVSPIAVIFIFISSLVNYGRASYGFQVFPAWGEALGWLMVMSSFIFVPAFAIYETCKRGGYEAMKRAAYEDRQWGPCVPKFWPENERYARKLEYNKKHGTGDYDSSLETDRTGNGADNVGYSS